MVTRPSRRGGRPSAFAISFGESEDQSVTTSDDSRKRDRSDAGETDLRGAKRRNLDYIPRPVRKYEPRQYEIEETKELLIFGEEQDVDLEDGRKRTRVLSRFTFFDARRDNNMVALDVLDGGAGEDHRIVGAGLVVARYDIDEDEGQEDDLEGEADLQYVRLSHIIRYFTRYWEEDSPFFVETDHAIYEVDTLNPSKRYRSQFSPFWRLQTILRFVISSASNDPNKEFRSFQTAYNRIEVFGQRLTEKELWDAVPKLRKTLETLSYADQLRKSTVIRQLLSRTATVIFKTVGKTKGEERQQLIHAFRIAPDYQGNLDLAVLRMSVPPHVTQRIADMALPLFRETLHIVAPRRPKPEEHTSGLMARLQTFLIRAQQRRLVQFRPNQRIGKSRWLKHIMIDDLKYEIGDTVLFYPGQDTPPNPNDLPPTDTLADHFWFARIMHMNELHETVHVQWFEHSSKTILQELGQSQELFLVDQCDTQALRHIVGKVDAHYIQPDQSPSDITSHNYFYRYLWNEYEGTFTNIDTNALAAFMREPPPDNCPACKIAKKFDEDTGPVKIHLGVRWHGVDYHLDDCVLMKADEGPCHIGQIIRFIHDNRRDDVEVIVRLFGRIDKLGSRPDTTLKDERHLFYTDDERTAVIDDLIDLCYVLVEGNIPDQNAWLAMSPYHFYVRYRFPSLIETSWASRRRMRWDELSVCRMCIKQNFAKMNGMKTFLEREAPLRVFDPFGGTGAFALAMEEMGCFKLTHAVEIVPSTAKTLQKNAPADVKVYNQCSNLVLRHAILAHENKHPEPLKSIEGHPLPPFPKPGDIDCLIGGFPCQPHSTMNMFKKANDKKSNLILTALSFVDFLKPSYCIFENVRGFLQYNLRARQDGKYAVKGGIPMGGLKVIIAALVDMGYQLRCGLLQAGHYGAPQTRVRFFLIAAKRGLELPSLPQPTHDFPLSDALEIKFPEGVTLQPITTLPGVAPHRYVSVHDAISDLPRFDWNDPKQVLSRRQREEKRIIECRESQPWCGHQGPDVPYEHEPYTAFQKRCRSQPTQDIQHYTRTYEPKKVERIVKVPIRPDADYRSLPRELWEYQFANPASSSGKTGFRAGYYGRVQRDGWFQTTVTNVDPMAKQCRVIHPYSKRILTVRELARSQGFPDHFVFYAQDDRVMTMHRQIGNAVPWPVSVAIARSFRETLYKEWAKRNPIPEEVEVEFTDDEVMNVD